MKICTKCKKSKPLTEYHKLKIGKGGLNPRCKECRAISKKEYCLENAESIRLKNKLYRIRNKENLKAKRKKWYEDNPDYNKEYRDKNWDTLVVKKREYRRGYRNERLKTDHLYKLKKTLRGRIWQAFKQKGWKKGLGSEILIGCKYETAKKHIESQFKDGMTWDNHGYRGWHIDHIIPLSIAKTEDEMIKLFNYTNLQPLWAKDNMDKSDNLWK